MITGFNRVFARIRRATRDHKGVAAVEFAILLPVMLTLYIGGNEVGHALTVARKVTHVSSSLADLATQSKTISNSDMCNIMDAAAAVITPYPTSHLRIKLTQVKIDSSSVAKVEWSGAYNDTALTKGSTVTLPTGVTTANTWVVIGEVHYAYTPTIGYVLVGTLDLSDKFYLRPRQSDSVAGPSSGTFSCS
jgi:Flp pilus assembly protein TadG